MATPKILGLHHVSAIASDAQANIDFYAGVLGLKLVKQTVNFDDPTGLHLYYGDETGSPGSLVTFFIIPGIQRGKTGWPQVDRLEFAAEVDANAWNERAEQHELLKPPRADLRPQNPPFLSAWNRDAGGADPDGLMISIRSPDLDDVPPAEQPLAKPGFRSPRSLAAASLAVRAVAPTLEFLSTHLGLIVAWWAEDHHLAELRLPNDMLVTVEDVTAYSTVEGNRGRPGAGTVHHVAFRIGSEEELGELRATLVEAGVNVSPVRDRIYFKSIYFREPGGILLEVATDGPGFAVDEPPEHLGERLCLPPWLEPRRAKIEAAVPHFTPPRR